jgi:hypothetical protein
MTDPTQDRAYFRCLPDSGLIEKGEESGDELAIALAERLEDTPSPDDPHKIDDMQDELDRARLEIVGHELTIERLHDVLRGMTSPSKTHFSPNRKPTRDNT